MDLSETHRHIDKRVKTLIVHSSFDKESYEFDIALLKLSSPVPFQVRHFKLSFFGVVSFVEKIRFINGKICKK